MENVLVYLDDILIISQGPWKVHFHLLDEVLKRLKHKNLRLYAEKSKWAQGSIEYLGFKLSQKGIKPQVKKVNAILNMKRPTNTKQLRQFLGLINFYKDMWPKQSHNIRPLTQLTNKKELT